MLISHSRRFLFIHVYKNAGTSITSALLPFTAPKWQRAGIKLWKKLHISYLDIQPFPIHSKASEISERMGQKNFDTYFTFAIIRNPWDWQVSLYKYMLKETLHHQHKLVKGFQDFNEYIEWRCSEEVRFQKDFLFSKNGDQLVDFIGRYENLEQDFAFICSQIGISTRLPRLNVSKTNSYTDYYNEHTKNLVRKTFEPDIHLFKYSFGSSPIHQGITI